MAIMYSKGILQISNYHLLIRFEGNLRFSFVRLSEFTFVSFIFRQVRGNVRTDNDIRSKILVALQQAILSIRQTRVNKTRFLLMKSTITYHNSNSYLRAFIAFIAC